MSVPTVPEPQAPWPFLDPDHARVRRRGEPRASIALAGAGCVLAVLGVLILAGDTGTSDGSAEFNRWPGFVMSIVVVAIGFGLMEVVRRGPVATGGAVAAALGVRSPSVTGMLKRLSDGEWIAYEPGTGARLTPLGLREARRVIRRHRLVELFLTRVLGLDWSEVDAEAEALEHAISPRLEQALAHYLGEPMEDPHGHPIPSPCFGFTGCW